jgi:hypothetical protein
MWLEGDVKIDDGSTVYPAQVSSRRWNGWAVPRFERAAMSRIVEDWHRLHAELAEQGMADCGYDLLWEGDAVLMRDYAYPQPERVLAYHEARIEPDAEGFYCLGSGLCWQTVDKPWSEREAALARLREDELEQTLGLVISCAGAQGRDAAIEALELMLAREGVPVGVLPEVGAELYQHWRRTLWER